MKKFLVVKGKAGLGNRMLAGVTAILYARLTGRQLIIDWRDYTYSNDGSNAFPHLFHFPESGDARQLTDAMSVYPAIWKGRLNKSANDLLDEFDHDRHSHPRIYRKYSFDLSRLDYPEDVLVMWSFNHQIDELRRHFTGKFSHYAARSTHSLLREILRTCYVPVSCIMEKIDTFKQENFQKNVVGLHVRFMDRSSKIQHFYTPVDKIKARHPESQVFLATDNPQVEQSMQARYGNVISTPKWFPKPASAAMLQVHQTVAKGLYRHDATPAMHQNPECPDRLTNGIEALIDMCLLSRCNYLVYPGTSTFSQIAADLSDMPSSHVTNIDRYNLKIQLKKVVRSLIS